MDLNEVNKKMKTVDIKGKKYVEVNERIKGFRELYPKGCIDHKIEYLDFDKGFVVISCDVYDEEGKKLSSDIAFEEKGSSFINKTSFVENCSTSSTRQGIRRYWFRNRYSNSKCRRSIKCY